MTHPERHSIVLDGHAHGSLPIPAASRVGNMIATGGVRGVDRGSGNLPDDVETQVSNMFENLIDLIAAGGGSSGTILKVTVFVKSPEARAALNPVWIRHFPDAAHRPARHVVDVPSLGGGMLVQAEALALTCD